MHAPFVTIGNVIAPAVAVCLSLGLPGGLFGPVARGQDPFRPFPSGQAAYGQAASGPGISAQFIAAVGQPYDVASIEIPLRNPVLGNGPGPLSVRWADPDKASGVILYPVSMNIQVAGRRPPSQQPLPRIGGGRLLNRVGNLIREIADGDAAEKQTVARRVSFLMPAGSVAGTNAGLVEVFDRNGVLGRYPIAMVNNPRLTDQLITVWWTDTVSVAKTQIDAADAPPWVPTYLVTMLSGRLGLPMPDWVLGTPPSTEAINPLLETLTWMGGGREVSDHIFASAAAGEPTLAFGNAAILASEASDGALTLPLPPGPRWQSDLLPDAERALDADVQTEPLASRIPPECFYVRYGAFMNFLWFQDLMTEFGGDVSRMVTLSGVETGGTKRLETQLGIQTTAMARLLGPTIITDQALIGRDLFLDDGAAMGIVMQATNAFLLRSSMNNDRTKLAASSESITLSDVELPHGKASLLRATDNAVRSFMVESDGFFCVTNSESIADRFLEVGQSGPSLAQTPGFRNARATLPLTREDTIFVYLSPEWMRGLLSPQSLIELRRRMRAEADIALVRLARLAFAAENPVAKNPAAQADASTSEPVAIDALIASGFLPQNFGNRGDGSGVVAFGDSLVDTARGGRGTFIPIADRTIDAVTAEESAWYDAIAAGYERQFARLDPIFVGLKREPIDADESSPEKRERLTIHAEIAPWQAAQYGWLAEQLGPPTTAALQFAPDDIIALQAHVVSDPLGPPTHLFVGIKDSSPPPLEDFDGLIGGYRSLQQLPGYLGAWPQPGALDRLPLGLGRGQPVGPGMTRLIGGVFRYTGGGFSVLSFQPDVMTASLPHLAVMQSDTSAQVRGRIGNPAGSRLENWVNEQLYQRAAVASAGGAEFLNSLGQKLDVAPETTLPVAQSILGGAVQCTLGGTYQYDAARGAWFSDAWGTDARGQDFQPPAVMPPGYQAPILTWFRGASFEITQSENRLVADADVIIARQ